MQRALEKEGATIGVGSCEDAWSQRAPPYMSSRATFACENSGPRAQATAGEPARRPGSPGARHYGGRRSPSQTEMFKRKQWEKKAREEEELKKLKNEAEIWKFINKKRRKRQGMTNNIKKEEWREHFKELLEGVENLGRKEDRHIVKGTREKEKGVEITRESEEEDLKEKEIEEALRRMKLKKSCGCDGIPMEAWKYAGRGLKKGMTLLLKQIWKEEVMPEDWKRSIIVPLHKRGDKEQVGNYRGISLLCSGYKIYAQILNKRLEKEVEDKGMLPESQTGFRRGRSTVDNIFILDHLIQREKGREKKEKKVFAFFVDLKAAFDKVDREELWKILREKRLNEELIKKIQKIYEETETVIRAGEEHTEKFWIKKGVRQGCALSPMLFNLYIADIDKEMENRNIGGMMLRKKRIWSIAYADDIVLLAKNREAIVDMMDTLGRFLRKRKLVLSAEKSKIVVFNKEGKEKVVKWKWKEEEIEEVQEFKYLGFILNRKGDNKDHIRKTARKGRMAANKVWGLGEKICKHDYGRRWSLFKYLVQSVMSYGVEIWGWDEKKELERVMLDYIRWIFNLDFCTPRYIIMRELRMDKLSAGWGIRAKRYEEKIKEYKEESLVKMCWKEKEESKWKDRYSKERTKYYNRNGWGMEAVENMRNEGKEIEAELIIREREVQRQWEGNRILEAKYNKRYKELGYEAEGPRYLQRKNMSKINKKIGIKALCKLRCGNLEEVNKYWVEEKKKVCLFCEKGQDSMKHYVSACRVTKRWFEGLGKNEKERWKRLWDDELDEGKSYTITKIWKEREKRMKEKRELEKSREYSKEGLAWTDE